MEDKSKPHFKFHIDRPIVVYAAIAIITLVALALVKYFNISYPIDVRSSQVSSELAVVGEGKVDVVPDNASVTVGISVVNAATVEAAQEEINTANNQIIQALAKLGIPQEQIKTSQYNINPTYQYDGGPERITGYSGNVTLEITVKDTAQLPQVIQTATTNGANQVFSTQMTVDNPQDYRAEARQKAIENAKEQAEELADELGIRLGRVTNIVESSPSSGPVAYDRQYLEAGNAGGAPAPDIQGGTQTISSTVTLYFEKR